jgi:hypothetical protein
MYPVITSAAEVEHIGDNMYFMLVRKFADKYLSADVCASCGVRELGHLDLEDKRSPQLFYDRTGM